MLQNALNRRSWLVLGLMLLGLLLVACSGNGGDDADLDRGLSVDDAAQLESNTPAPTSTTRPASNQPFADVTIPELPFADNPDPNECGIPQPYGQNNNTAYLNGIYEGEVIQPTVYLYNSHARTAITAAASHGTQVEVIMYQANPVLDYYFVKIPDGPQGQREGWIPEPLLSFDPVEPLPAS